ncbi:MAG TPA: hypothetical protein VNK04_07670 [Gemmataceae bacterium]|nr:hypothetical protein [Gemmataceae bacterium]
MITLLGKVLVCANLIFSMVLATLAFGVYTQRISWAGKTAPDQAKSELDQRREQIRQNWEALLAADTRRQTALAEVVQAERQRPADQQWYAAVIRQLQHLPPDKPVQVAVQQEGQMVPDPQNFGRPTLKNGEDRFKKPLLSWDAYAQRIKEVSDQIAVQQERWAKLAEESTAWTQRLTGPKGLWQRYADEDDKRRRVQAEMDDFVLPQLLNVQVESETLLQRRDELQKRLEELRRAASRPTGP